MTLPNYLLLFVLILLAAAFQVTFLFFPVLVKVFLDGDFKSIHGYMGNYLVYGLTSGVLGFILILKFFASEVFNIPSSVYRQLALILLLLYAIFAYFIVGFYGVIIFLLPFGLIFSANFVGNFWIRVGIGVISFMTLQLKASQIQITFMFAVLGVANPAFSLMLLVFLGSLPIIFYFISLYTDG